MGKPKRRTGRLADMSLPPEERGRSSRRSKAHADSDGAQSAAREHDWLAESRCATCHRDVPRTTLLAQVTQEGKGLCDHCWSEVAAYLRRPPTKSRVKAGATTSLTRTPEQAYAALVKQRDRESEAILEAIPGTTLAEKLDSIERGLVGDEPEPIAPVHASLIERRRWVKQQQALREQRRVVALDAVERSLDPRYRCDGANEDCGYVGRLSRVEKHQFFTGHIFRSRLEED